MTLFQLTYLIIVLYVNNVKLTFIGILNILLISCYKNILKKCIKLLEMSLFCQENCPLDLQYISYLRRDEHAQQIMQYKHNYRKGTVQNTDIGNLKCYKNIFENFNVQNQQQQTRLSVLPHHKQKQNVIYFTSLFYSHSTIGKQLYFFMNNIIQKYFKQFQLEDR